MSGGPRKIGFDRRLELDWLDTVAGRLAAGDSPKEAREAIWKRLEGVLSGETAHGARGKTLTVLSAIWLAIPPARQPLRAAALVRFNEVAPAERLALHWTMTLAAYPFFLDVAAQTGKLLGLNGDCTFAQVHRRMLDRWGDRSTLTRAVQRVLRSMVGWGALREGASAGDYQPPPKRLLVAEATHPLLLEGLLHAVGHGLALDSLTGHPALFPFDLHLNPLAFRRQPRFRVYRQGDQTDWVEVGDGAFESAPRGVAPRPHFHSPTQRLIMVRRPCPRRGVRPATGATAAPAATPGAARPDRYERFAPNP